MGITGSRRSRPRLLLGPRAASLVPPPHAGPHASAGATPPAHSAGQAARGKSGGGTLVRGVDGNIVSKTKLVSCVVQITIENDPNNNEQSQWYALQCNK